MSFQELRFGSIGAGHMGGAVINALLDARLFGSVHVSSPVDSELEPFAKRGCITGNDNLRTAANCDLLLLATRPHQLLDALSEIKPALEGKCVLSIAAGVTLASIRAVLPRNAFAIRAMPNLGLTMGAGATALASPDGVPEHFTVAAKAVFECAGRVEFIDEELIDSITPVNGSGIAYFFRMADVMTQWAEEQGIARNAALNLTAQTLLGASKMLLAGKKTPQELAQSVAVPGGTTQAAFEALDRTGFDQSLRAGLDACRIRAGELQR